MATRLVGQPGKPRLSLWDRAEGQEAGDQAPPREAPIPECTLPSCIYWKGQEAEETECRLLCERTCAQAPCDLINEEHGSSLRPRKC